MKTKFNLILLIVMITSVWMTSCTTQSGTQLAEGAVYPDASKFESVINGKQTSLYTLVNANGLRADITNYGGRVVSLFVPDRNGVFDDIVTGYHSIDEFVASEELYFGAIIGRYGNRIGNGTFSINDEQYTLAANNGENHLHGGPGGFHAVVWDATQVDGQTLVLTYLSEHMEEGYPGNLNVEVTYHLNNNDELVITYNAVTDSHTVVNLTNHAFFNLAGEGSSSINNHFLKINADYYTPVDQGLIPTGEIATVEGTPFDFREFRQIGERIDSDHQQMVFGMGYDHNFVLNHPENSDELNFAAAIYDPVSGRLMEVLTQEPGLQFYGGNFLSGNETGKRGEAYVHRSSFCLETQHFPDSPNKPNFPSTLLEPGQQYNTVTVYRFRVKE
jgi:aldose 1-epimerase